MTDKQLIGAEAPPAASALDGTEVLHVVQGANSRVTTTQDIAGLAAAGGGGAGGAYAPAVTANEGITVIDPVTFFDFGEGFYTRTGGATPKNGDIASVGIWLAAVNEGQDPLTAELSAPLPSDAPFYGAITPGSSASLGASGSDPWDGPPWDVVYVADGVLRARFDLAAPAASARWVTVSYPVVLEPDPEE